MDAYRQASGRMTRGPRTAILMASTPEERTTHRRWACAVLACYCLLFVCGCFAALAEHSNTKSDNQLGGGLISAQPSLNETLFARKQ
jgi:hypothetical protein